MKVFCLRCVYGVLSDFRAELRISRDDVCALRETQLISSSQLREVVNEGCRCKCNCKDSDKDMSIPLVNERHQIPSKTSQTVTTAAAVEEQVSVNQTSAAMKRPHTPTANRTLPSSPPLIPELEPHQHHKHSPIFHIYCNPQYYPFGASHLSSLSHT